MAKKNDFLTVGKGAMRKVITPALNRAAEQARRVMVAEIKEDIIKHPFSQDLMSHQDPSPTLGSIGSLFGFMGFNEGRNPVVELLNLFRRKSSFNLILAEESAAGSTGIVTKLQGLSDEQMVANNITLDKWQDGRSWPEVVESGGLYGLSSFLGGSNDYDKSRSKEGIQLKKSHFNVSDSLPPIPYLTPIFERAKRRFREVLLDKLK